MPFNRLTIRFFSVAVMRCTVGDFGLFKLFCKPDFQGFQEHRMLNAKTMLSPIPKTSKYSSSLPEDMSTSKTSTPVKVNLASKKRTLTKKKKSSEIKKYYSAKMPRLLDERIIRYDPICDPCMISSDLSKILTRSYRFLYETQSPTVWAVLIQQ